MFEGVLGRLLGVGGINRIYRAATADGQETDFFTAQQMFSAEHAIRCVEECTEQIASEEMIFIQHCINWMRENFVTRIGIEFSC